MLMNRHMDNWYLSYRRTCAAVEGPYHSPEWGREKKRIEEPKSHMNGIAHLKIKCPHRVAYHISFRTGEGVAENIYVDSRDSP